ncbi:MAG: abortive infection protein [Anaerosolibacter sp.]|uniref:CPBP family intramembrane glutamic endopeptidase n=1 Tax=Anaerosolibacter sp. TaxID=1872527 RepID=UPI00261ABA6A|nr:CPBP family intramembrane glutamic endopeptidase [Anaerosolibacter sp.]MDF2545982.1 abortive infection protein [Anaerosolibacter sp.]
MDQRAYVSRFVSMLIVLVASAIILKPVLIMQHQSSIFEIILFEIMVISITIILGIQVSNKLEIAIWKKSSDTKRTIVIGALCTFVNMSIYFISRDQVLQWMPFMETLTPVDAIALSVRAAIQEEIVYRVFLMPLFVLILRSFKIDTNRIVAIGAILSSIFFGLNHPGFFIAFSYGLVLCYVYYKDGLLPAMIVHFFADAGPFLLLTVMQKGL